MNSGIICETRNALDLPNTPMAFVGAGSIAEALLRGLIAAGIAGPDTIILTNRSDRGRLERLAATYGVRTTPDKREALAAAGIVVLAVKPADAPAALAECRAALAFARAVAPAGAPARQAVAQFPLLVSVVAGLRTTALEAWLPEGARVVRAMPNTSCSVGESATALAVGRWAGAADLDAATSIFEAVGLTAVVDEDLLDAVTGLSGSGPAYLYLFLEAMTEAGTALGLDAGLAYRLALQTIRGAAETARQTGENPADLRRRVSSPGGTTLAGLAALEGAGFRQAVVDAVRRAARRSAELSSATG